MADREQVATSPWVPRQTPSQSNMAGAKSCSHGNSNSSSSKNSTSQHSHDQGRVSKRVLSILYSRIVCCCLQKSLWCFNNILCSCRHPLTFDLCVTAAEAAAGSGGEAQRPEGRTSGEERGPQWALQAGAGGCSVQLRPGQQRWRDRHPDLAYSYILTHTLNQNFPGRSIGLKLWY